MTCFGCDASFSSCFCRKCECCAKAIFVMGISRHHCRTCGAALCGECWIRRTSDGRLKVCRNMDSCTQRVNKVRIEKPDKIQDDCVIKEKPRVSTSRRYKWKRFLTSSTKVISSTKFGFLQTSGDSSTVILKLIFKRLFRK